MWDCEIVDACFSLCWDLEPFFIRRVDGCFCVVPHPSWYDERFASQGLLVPREESYTVVVTRAFQSHCLPSFSCYDPTVLDYTRDLVNSWHLTCIERRKIILSIDLTPCPSRSKLYSYAYKLKRAVKYSQISLKSTRKMQSCIILEALQSVSCVSTNPPNSYRRRRLSWLAKLTGLMSG